MQSLEWGLATDVETEVTQRLCLQTMAAMAEHAYRTLQAAQGGQGSARRVAVGNICTKSKDIGFSYPTVSSAPMLRFASSAPSGLCVRSRETAQ